MGQQETFVDLGFIKVVPAWVQGDASYQGSKLEEIERETNDMFPSLPS
jgi:hypothetical protein